MQSLNNINQFDVFKNEKLQKIEELEIPYCLRTLKRAILLLCLNDIEPTNANHFKDFGFSGSGVKKFFREFIRAKLVSEKYFLYRLTEKGKSLIGKLLQDPIVASYMNYHHSINVSDGRPSVTRLE